MVRADYERARRKGFVRAIASWLRRSDNALLAFEEMRQGIHAHAQRDGGSVAQAHNGQREAHADRERHRCAEIEDREQGQRDRNSQRVGRRDHLSPA
ncbi:MAG: hypothetical protein ACRDG6_02260, partial [Candidatus Limnocylindria bacterium]